jgi:hypothetical protein
VPVIPTVTLGGTACTNVVVVNNTTITCTTPARAAGLVDVAVTIDGQTATLANAYTYTESSLSISSSGFVSISATPTNLVYSTNDVLTITTSNPSGYSLKLSMSSDGISNQPLRKDGTSSTYQIVPASSLALGVNEWGYSLTGLANSWRPVSTPSTPDLLKSTSIPTSPAGDATSVYFGVRINSTLPIGSYSGIVVYTAVAN